MTGNITWEMVLTLLSLAGAAAGLWKYVSGAIGRVSRELQEYKLHVAETYATRDGVDRQFESVGKSIDEVGKRMEARLDGVNERLDRFIESRPTVRRSGSSS